MHFTGEVDIPQELLDAQSDGNLVVFAGAGVSMGEPSNLPSFEDLAKQIAYPNARSKNEPIDRFLGRLADCKCRIRQLTQDIIGNKDSRPTDLHKNLVKLFRKPSEIRIVTTNFDLHFTGAIQAVFGKELEVSGKEFPTYIGPALPLGDSFSGLVYLHGRLHWPPEQEPFFVLTDKDFGSAYVVNGWACRFLVPMFSKYKVLFVGYSHNDPIMDYLARALPVEEGRYALVPSSDKLADWEYRGITPLQYPSRTKKDHKALDEAISEWARITSFSPSDHKTRIRDLVENDSAPLPAPVLNPKEDDYLTHALTCIDQVQFFIKYARHTCWLRWAKEKTPFKAIFYNSDLNLCSRMLLEWFIYIFILEGNPEALDVCTSHTAFLNSWFVRRLCLELSLSQCKNELVYNQWIPLLIMKGKENDDNTADNWAATIPRLKHSPELVLVVLRHISLESAISTVSAYKLDKIWDEVLCKNLDIYSYDVLTIFTEALINTYRLKHITNSYATDFDIGIASRLRIEYTEERAGYKTVWNVIISILRNTVEWLLENDDASAQFWINQWFKSPITLLRRLAIHGINKQASKTAESKLAFIEEYDLAKEHTLHHEVFMLAADAYTQSADFARNTFLKYLKLHYTNLSEEPEYLGQDLFRWVYWLLSKKKDCVFAQQLKNELLLVNPNLKTPKHPDLLYWIETDMTSPVPPISKEELATMPISELINYLISFEPTEEPWSTRTSLLGVLCTCITEHYNWSIELVNEFIKTKMLRSDIWESVILGWSHIELTSNQYKNIFSILHNAPSIAISNRETTQLLEKSTHLERVDFAQIKNEALEFGHIVSAHIYCDDGKEISAVETNRSWLNTAINTPGGLLAEFWINALLKSTTYPSENPELRFPEEFRGAFVKMLVARNEQTAMARVILAGYLHVFVALDREWTIEHLLPLMDFNRDREEANRVWDGFLHVGQISLDIFDQMRPLYKEAISNISDNQPWRIESFSDHIAFISLYFLLNPLEDWLWDFIEKRPKSFHEKMAKSIATHLPRLGEAKTKIIWNSWLKKYCQQRVMGSPVPLTSDEYGYMLAWLPSLPLVFDDAVDVLLKAPTISLRIGRVIHDFAKSELSETHANSVALLINHLLKTPNNERRLSIPAKINDLIQKLKKGGISRENLKSIVNRLAEIGFPEYLKYLEEQEP